MLSLFLAASRAARSRFWLTFATFWLVGWLSVTPVHALIYDWDCTSAHCDNTSLPAHSHHSHTGNHCGGCHLGQWSLVSTTSPWQFVFIPSVCYLVRDSAPLETRFCASEISSIQRRGPPLTPHFV